MIAFSDLCVFLPLGIIHYFETDFYNVDVSLISKHWEILLANCTERNGWEIIICLWSSVTNWV